MSVQPAHPTTASRIHGIAGGPVPAPTRVEAAPTTKSTDEHNGSSFTDDRGMGRGDHGAAAHGVHRLLQEGHFRGVADARLRSKFGVGPSEPAPNESNTVFQQRLAEMSDRFVSLADALIPPELQTEAVAGAFADALATFQENASAAQTDAEESGSVSYAAVLSNVQDAFDTFSASVRETLSAQPGAPEDARDGSAPASFELSDFMDQLTGVFSETLAELTGAAGSSAHAYSKSVAEYSRLRSPAEPAERVNIQA